jgi:hypothetical protein
MREWRVSELRGMTSQGAALYVLRLIRAMEDGMLDSRELELGLRKRRKGIGQGPQK